MKRILTFLLAAALLLTSLSCALSASAAAESSDWMTKLTNKTLIQVVEKEIGKGWTLYQPNPREEDTKMSSNSFLKNVKLYPVVARKDDAMQLIILKKVNGKWKVDICNDKALTRPELTIRNFSMDENVSSSDTKYTVYFDYLDAEGKVYVLSLTLYTEFESMFDDLYYLDGGVWESPSVSIEFKMTVDLNFTAIIRADTHQRIMYICTARRTLGSMNFSLRMCRCNFQIC